jgi:hypothetical protein
MQNNNDSPALTALVKEKNFLICRVATIDQKLTDTLRDLHTKEA